MLETNQVLAADHTTPLLELVVANQQTLSGVRTLLQSISDDSYRSVTPPFTASLGRHMRHITDHYEQLLRGAESGRIDYDGRERSELLETCRTEMLSLLEDIESRLSSLGSYEDRQIDVALCVDENIQTPEVPSTLSRELVFLQSHTTHHCAIISAILKIQGASVPEGFGIAASTLKYEQLQCAH